MNDRVNLGAINHLKQWVKDNIVKGSGQMIHWQALSGDASLRQYFRTGTKDNTLIAVFSPPSTQNNGSFIQINALLKQQAIPVPEILAYDQEQGFMLQQDLGDRLLLDVLTPNTVDAWYSTALTLLHQFAAFAPEAIKPLKPYDEESLRAELSLFQEWFLEKLLGYNCSESEQRLLSELYDRLISSALAQPSVFVHRDFHSRNLMIMHQDQLAVIDFQDAVLGPITYDLVSLLKDCYIEWPTAQVEQWVLGFYSQLTQSGIIAFDDIDEALFLRWFHSMGLQRHLKVLGVFARLSIRDGKQGFLHDLPLVIRYVLGVCQQEPELNAFMHFFENKLIPLIREQPWGKGL